jgi:hypothetical protein
MKKQLFFLISAFLLVSCTGNGENSSYSYPEATAEKAMAQDYDGSAESGPAEIPERKVVRTANLRMEVASFKKATEKILESVATQEAEIFQQEEQQYGYQIEQRMTIKVPPENLDVLLETLESLATYVDQKSIDKEDVTQKYIDLESRLENKRAVIKRYQELMAQAKNVQEVIAVEENLRKVVEEVESMERQFQYLQQQLSRSTLYLTYYERLPEAVNTRSFGIRIIKGFANGWQLLKDLAIGLISIWPILILLSLAVGWWVRRRRKRRSA